MIAQDTRSKAYFHCARSGLRRCLVVDLGTSLGGACIDARGTIPALLGQVGRVAHDLSDDARRRKDGRGQGLLSQWTSATGLRETAGRLGSAVTDPNRLDSAVESGEPAVRSLIREFSSQSWSPRFPANWSREPDRRPAPGDADADRDRKTLDRHADFRIP
ncbi:hypothetical protein [Nocardiopsis ansamitocini]|uniref:hypothetical protein n=1 Tax=Nocardiopsis ansamitocini TaxID=1670832 RepID=UPI002552DEDF|nr:hypothetical protein [Nocardiopsis ansamitocini]